MNKIVAPSVLSIDFTKITTQIKRLEVAGATWLHYDVMDGVFVDNISFGPGILKQINGMTDLFLDVHLMIENPMKYFDAFIEAGADQITVHIESFSDGAACFEALKYLKSKGLKMGITLKPDTEIEEIVPFLKMVDCVLVMSVQPGFGGQEFMSDMLERIATLVDMRDLNQYGYLISVDGGINQETGKRARLKGADVLVAGSYIFNEDIEKAITSLL